MTSRRSVISIALFFVFGCGQYVEENNEIFHSEASFYGTERGGWYLEKLADIEEKRLSEYPENSSMFRLFIMPGGNISGPNGEAIVSNYAFRLEQRDQKSVLVFKASTMEYRNALAESFSQELSDSQALELVKKFQNLRVCQQPLEGSEGYDGTDWLIEGFGKEGEPCIRAYIFEPRDKDLRAFQHVLFSAIPANYSKYRWCDIEKECVGPSVFSK